MTRQSMWDEEAHFWWMSVWVSMVMAICALSRGLFSLGGELAGSELLHHKL